MVRDPTQDARSIMPRKPMRTKPHQSRERSGSDRALQARRYPSSLDGSPLFPPDQEEPDIARKSVGIVEHARGETKPVRFQVSLPAQIQLRCLAAQRCRPVRFARIERAAAIAAELARKAQQHELLFPLLGRHARLMNQFAPALVREMPVDEIRHPSLPLL